MSIETSPQPAYILCSSDYFTLNRKLSEAKGWKIGDATERCLPVNPRAAKVNIEYDEEGKEISYEGMLVLPVSSKDQQDYPELFENYELVSSYTPVDVPLDFIDILNLDEITMLWTAEHCVRLKVTFDGLVLTLPLVYHDLLSEEIITAINQLGVILIFE